MKEEAPNILLSNSRIGVRSGSFSVVFEEVSTNKIEENSYFDKFNKSRMIRNLPNILEKHKESSVISNQNKELLELLNKELINDVNLIYKSKLTASKLDIVKTAFIGAGYGMAMMPIFNNQVYNLDDYGIDIHSAEWAFDVSTANTMLVTSAYAMMIMYQHIIDQKNQVVPDDIENIMLSDRELFFNKANKVFVMLASCIPLVLLWEIELQNKRHDHSEGFDKFISWATFATIPVIIFKTIESNQNYKNYIQNEIAELDNIASKVIVYGISGLSALGRSVAYTVVATKAFEKIIPEDASLGLGITMGGLLSATSTNILAFNQMKSLFSKQTAEISKKNIGLSIIATLEGIWMAMPIVLTAIKYTNDWSSVIKYVLFLPFLLGQSICESSKFYHAFQTKEKELDITDITKIANEKYNDFYKNNEILESRDLILEKSYNLIGEATNENA